MIATHPDCPPGVTLLADHLDTALAAGEDLLGCRLDARADLDERDAASAPEAMDRFVARAMQLEASLLLRVLQVRRLSGEISRTDSTLKSIGGLFRAQTDLLQVLIDSRSRGSDAIALARAGDGHAYLRSRGLLAPEAAAPSPYEAVVVSEAFRVGGVVPLGGLLDLVSGFLDFIDARYGLYQAEPTTDISLATGDTTMPGVVSVFPGSLPAFGAAAPADEAEAPADADEAGLDDASLSADSVDVMAAADGAMRCDPGASDDKDHDDDAILITAALDDAPLAPALSQADEARLACDLAAELASDDVAGNAGVPDSVDDKPGAAPARPDSADHDTLRRSLKAMLAEVHRPV